jgi:hypothetical protein
MPAPRITKPRCFLIYALAPENVSAAEANRQFNTFIGDGALPLVLFHDHFIGQPGGFAIFFAENEHERDALANYQSLLKGWSVELRPLIFSYSPAAFDEQIAFTLKAYRGMSWERLQRELRPAYGNPSHEVEVAAEVAEPEG